MPDSFTCDQCNKTFKNRGSLNLHMYKTHKIKDVKGHFKAATASDPKPKDKIERDDRSCRHEWRMLNPDDRIECIAMVKHHMKQICELCEDLR